MSASPEQQRPPCAEPGTARDDTRSNADALFRAAFDRAPVGMAHLATDGRFLTINDRFCLIVGHDRQALLRCNFRDITYPDDIARDDVNLRAMLNGEVDRYLTEKRYVRSDGEIVWAQLTASLLRDPEGAPIGLVAVLEDIGHRRQLEASLLERKRLLRDLADHADGPVWVKDLDGRFLLVNAYMEQRHGLGRDALIGRTVFDVYPHALAAEYTRNDRQVIDTGTAAVFEEADVGPVDQRVHLSKKFPLLDEAGRIYAIGAICVDITQRKRDEAALRQWADAFEHCAHGIRIGDPATGLIVACNPALARMRGMAIDEIVGAPIFDMYVPAERERVGLNIARADVDGQVRYESRMIRGDGTEFPVQMDVVSVRDAAGALRYRVATVQDLTERHAAAAADAERRQLQDRLTRIATTVPGVLYSFRLMPDGAVRFPYASEAFAGIIGLEPDAFVDDAGPVFERIHPDDIERVRHSIAESAATLAPWRQEFRFMHVKGHEIWIEAHSVPERDPDGGTTWHGYLHDVTERKHAEMALRDAQHELEVQQAELEQRVTDRTAALRQQASYLLALIDNFPFRVWLKDTQRRYLAANRTMASAAGLDVCELIGRTDLDVHVWPPEVATRRHAQDGLVIASRDKTTAEEEIVDALGSTWLETYDAPVFDADGTVLGTVGFARDITDRKAVDAAREAALAEAKRLAKMRSDFLANMSHEIRTPLNAVLGLAQIGMRSGFEGRAVDAFGRILDSGQHLLGVIDDILDYSKIEAGKLAVEQGTFSPAQVIDRAVGLTAGLAQAKGLAFVVDEAFDLPETCRGDGLRVSQVLVNLLSNAIKFTPAGTVTLEALTEDHALVLRVRDSGIGMTPDQVARLFQPFEQADGSTTRRFGGTGLGLAISRHLVELMGGTICVSSIPAVGSDFDVRLPLDVATVASSPPQLSVVLAGFADDEATLTSVQLAAVGASPNVVPPSQAFDEPVDLVVLPVEALDPAVIDAVVVALGQGRRVAVVARPGGDSTLPSTLRGRVAVIDRPLRVRHIVAAGGFVPARTSPGNVAAARLDGLRVLVAEDSEVNRVVLEQMLEPEGVRLTLCADGREALDRLRADGPHAFDIVLTDIQMPVMDGYEFARAARTLDRELPIIGLTAHAMEEERDRCLAVGMVDHIAKPVDLDELVRRIRHHARRVEVRAAPPEAAPAIAAIPAVPDGSAPIIDWAAAAVRFKGRTAFVDRLAGIARADCRETPDVLRAAVRVADRDSIAFIAHSLKSVSGNLAMTALFTLASRTERAARDDAPDAMALTEQLAQGVEQMLAEIDRRLG